ncbi:MAG: threonyl-tRNA synthetase editing domain-containing protein [Nanoarchaeota archaeon]
MKSLIVNAKNFGVEFDSLANRPKEIFHEEVNGKEKQECTDCVVVFITVEEGDGIKAVDGIVSEIIKTCKDVNRNKAVIVPFAHLSNNLAKPKQGFEIIKEIESKLKETVESFSAHFGSNKSLLLEIYGHTGNCRFREF